MYTFRNHLHKLVEELERGSALRGTSDGGWTVDGPVKAFINNIFSSEMYRLSGLAKGLRLAMDELESEPVVFLQSISIQPEQPNQPNQPEQPVQPVNYNLYIRCAEILIKKLAGYTSTLVESERLALQKSLIALLYRLGECNGGLDPLAPGNETAAKILTDTAEDTAEDLESILNKLALDWKQDQIVFDKPDLTDQDKQTLREASNYHEFAKLIILSPDIREDFFIWALRDKIAVAPFIQFPATAAKINHVELNGRIGRMGGHHLKIQFVKSSTYGDGILEKVLTLPFEGRDISILDERRTVVFRGNYPLTIKEIFQIFWNKRYGPGNLEFMAEGIINWHAHFWGWWDQKLKKYHLVDFDQPEWWKQLPIHEILSLKAARAKFGLHLDGRQWNFAAISTRQTKTLDYDGSHAYTSLAIPNENGSYVVYTFGKYAFKFPRTFLEGAMNLGETSDATIAYPDENVYYTHRQKGRYSFGLTEKQGRAYLASVRRDMLLSREGNFVYQIESENCAKWSQQKIEEVLGKKRIPNLFQMPFLDSEPHGFMAYVFTLVKKFPTTWHAPLAIGLHFPFASYKGKWIWEEGKRIWRGLIRHEFWEDEIIYHPAMLYKVKESGLIGQSLGAGVTFSGQVIRDSYSDLWRRLEDFGLIMVSTTAKRMKWVLEFLGETYRRVVSWCVTEADKESTPLVKTQVIDNEQVENYDDQENNEEQQQNNVQNTLNQLAWHMQYPEFELLLNHQ